MRRRYFEATENAIREYHDPGEFVTLFGYEWTQQPTVGGHLNVYFDSVDDAKLFDSMSAESDTYEKLWDRLREFNDEPWRTVEHGDGPEDFGTYTVDRTWTEGAAVTGLSWDNERESTADVYYVRVRQADDGQA